MAWIVLALTAAVSLRAEGARAAGPDDNTAIVPVSKLEEDSYDWFARHEAVLSIKDQLKPEIVMIGDSITHFWAGPPLQAKNQRGPKAWNELFGQRRVLNMGFGWDRTQNVLWRLDHGEFDGLRPRYVVLNIGTNNFSTTAHARANTPAQVAEAIRAICDRIHAKSPDTQIIVMAVFPRGQNLNDPFRAKIAELNKLLPNVLKSRGIRFLDIGGQFLNPDGSIPPALMDDFCHPTEQGYAIWAKALKGRIGP
jgi:lysophospholipase L1-like esterase